MSNFNVADKAPKVSNNDGAYGYRLIDNYVYLYHTGTLIWIPTYPETISDSMTAHFGSETPLSRSAPIYSYQNSGPRSVQIDLKLHRDLMSQMESFATSLNIKKGVNSLANIDEDYLEVMIREIQGAAIPKYGASDKMVNPPMIAVKFGSEFYCKGVVDGSVGVTYSGPILRTSKYANVDISFTVSEVDPYDAATLMRFGSYRGEDTAIFNNTLERNLFSLGNAAGGQGGTRTVMVK